MVTVQKVSYDRFDPRHTRINTMRKKILDTVFDKKSLILRGGNHCSNVGSDCKSGLQKKFSTPQKEN